MTPFSDPPVAQPSERLSTFLFWYRALIMSHNNNNNNTIHHGMGIEGTNIFYGYCLVIPAAGEACYLQTLSAHINRGVLVGVRNLLCGCMDRHCYAVRSGILGLEVHIVLLRASHLIETWTKNVLHLPTGCNGGIIVDSAWKLPSDCVPPSHGRGCHSRLLGSSRRN